MSATHKVTFRIDGRDIQAPEGSFVLQAARQAGIAIPTLCDHPDLEPVGACRLCMVEVTHPSWGGWKGLMTACLYPVSEGIDVSTKSETVLEARRGILSLLAARCPDSPQIKALAAQYGAKFSRLNIDDTQDNCIVCGLCTRVCEAYATAAISTYSRGSQKRVGPFDAAPPEECVGCGACALICPTKNIPVFRRGPDYQIWSRTFSSALCRVESSRCMGCGACEEACPFSVARLTLFRSGERLALIPEEHCRGCGACVGACPSGAIHQSGYSWDQLIRPASSLEEVQ